MPNENTLTTAELLRQLAVGAIEMYAIGGRDCDEEAAIFLTAMPVVAYAFGDADSELAAELARVHAQREAVFAAAPGEAFPLTEDDIDLFLDPGTEEIGAVFGKLLDALELLDERADREAVTALMRYLTVFWDLTECLEMPY